MLSLLESRSSLRLTAVFTAGVLLLFPLPSRASADDEILSLVSPRDGEMTGGTSFDSDPSSIVDELFEPRPASTETGRPSTRVHLERVDTHDVMTMDLPLDGRLTPEDEKTVARFFRCRRTGKQRPMNPGVLALLADVAVRWPERTIEIISGFRAPPYGAPHSKHYKGEAIDLRVAGIRTTVLRDYVWRQNNGVGVGYYQKENFVHMDSRPDAHDRAWSGSEEGGPEELNPRWARKARRNLPTPKATPPATPLAYRHAPTTHGGTF